MAGSPVFFDVVGEPTPDPSGSPAVFDVVGEVSPAPSGGVAFNDVVDPPPTFGAGSDAIYEAFISPLGPGVDANLNFIPGTTLGPGVDAPLDYIPVIEIPPSIPPKRPRGHARNRRFIFPGPVSDHTG